MDAPVWAADDHDIKAIEWLTGEGEKVESAVTFPIGMFGTAIIMLNYGKYLSIG